MFLAVSCSDLGFVIRIVKYLIKLVRYIVPIALIALTVFDFTKGISSTDNKLSDKAKSNMVKRVILAVVIFLIPEMVNLIFNVININTSGSHLYGPKDYIACFRDTNV